MENDKNVQGVNDMLKTPLSDNKESLNSLKTTTYDPNVTKRTVHYTEILSAKDKASYNQNSFQNENTSKEMNYSSSITRVNSNISPSLHSQSHTNYMSTVSASATLNNEIIPNMDSSLSSPIPPINPINNNQTEPLTSSFINTYSTTSISSNIDTTNTPGIDNTNTNIFKSYRDMNEEKDFDLCAYFDNISFNDKSDENIGLSHALFGDLNNSLSPNKSFESTHYKSLLLGNYKSETDAIAKEISLTESEKFNLQSTFKEMEEYQRSRKQFNSESNDHKKPSLDDLLKTDFNKFVVGDESTSSIANITITKETDVKEKQEGNDNTNHDSNKNDKVLPILNTEYVDKENEMKTPTVNVRRDEDKDLLEMIKDELLLKGSFCSNINNNNNNSSDSPASTYNTTGLSTPTVTMKTNTSSGWNHPFLKNSMSSNLTGISSPFTIHPPITPQSGMTPKSQASTTGLSTPPVKNTVQTPSVYQPLPVRTFDLSMAQPQEYQQESFSIVSQFGPNSIALDNGSKTPSNIMPLSSFGVIIKDSDLKGSINIGNSDAVTIGSVNKDAEAIAVPENPFQTFGDGRKVLRPDENEGYRGQMILTDIKDELNFNSFTSSFSSLNEGKINLSPIEQTKSKKEDDKKKKEEEKKKKKKKDIKKRKEEKKKKEEEKKKKKREEKLLKEEKKKKNTSAKDDKSKKNIFMLSDDKNSVDSLKDKIILGDDDNKKSSPDVYLCKPEEENKESLKEVLFNDERKKDSITSIKDVSVLSKSDSNINKYAFLEDYITNLNYTAKNAYPIITAPTTPPHSPLNPSKRGSDVVKIVNQRKSLLASLPSPLYSPTDLSLSPGKFFMKRSSLIQSEDLDIDMSNPDAIPHRYSSVSPRTRPLRPISMEDEDIPRRLSSISPRTRPISRTSTSLRYSINSMMSNFNLPTSLSLVEGGILAPDSPSLLIKEKQGTLTTKPSMDAESLRSKSSFSNSYRSFSSELDHNLKKQQKYHQQTKNRHHRVGSNGSYSTTTTANTNSPLNHTGSHFGHRKDTDTESIESYESFSSELNESLKRQKRRSRTTPTGRISPHTEAIEVKSQGSPYSNINSLNDLLYIKEYNSEKNHSEFKVNKSRFSSSSYNLNIPATRKYGENRLSYYSVRPANRNSISQYSNTTTDTNENDFENFVENLMHTKHHQKYDNDMNAENVMNIKRTLGSSSPSSSEKRTKLSSSLPSSEEAIGDLDSQKEDVQETVAQTQTAVSSETVIMKNEGGIVSSEMNESDKLTHSPLKSPGLKISTEILKKEETEIPKTASPSSPFTPLSKISVNSNGDPTFSKRTTSLLSKKQREQLETMGKIALNKECVTPKSPFKNVHPLEDIKEDGSFVIPPKPSVQVNNYKSSHQKSPSITSQSSVDSNGSRSSRNSAKRQAIYGNRGSIASQLSSHNSHSSRQVNVRNPRTSILKTSTTESSDTNSPTPSSVSKRVSISEKPQRIEYSYGRDRSFSLNNVLGSSPTSENRLSQLSESNVENNIRAESLPRPKKVEYTNVYPKRSSMVTNIGYGTLRSNSTVSNSVGSSSKTGESHRSNNRSSLTSSLSHPLKADYMVKRSSLSTTVTSSSSLGRPKKIEYRNSLLSSSGTSSLNRPVKIEYLKKKNGSSYGVSSTMSVYTNSSSGNNRSTKSSKEDSESSKRNKIMRIGVDSANSSPTKERNMGLEKIKENEILDNSAEDSFLLQCSLNSTSIDRLNISFSKETNINQSFSFSSLSGVAEFLSSKNNNIKAMIEKSKPLYNKEANSFTSINTSSIVPPSGIIIGPDDLKERKIFSLSGNSSGYSSSHSTVSRFNQTISFASVSSIPDSAINRNVNRVSCINLGLSSGSSSASSTLGHRHTLSTHVCISDFDSITTMSTGFKDRIKSVMSQTDLTQDSSSNSNINDDSNLKDSINSKSNDNSGSTPSQPLKSSLDESIIDKVDGEEESFANSSSSSIMKPYIPGFDNRNKSMSFISSHLSSSIYNFVNKETLENQRLYLQSKKTNISNEEANLNATANTSNVMNTSDIIPNYSGIHSNKVNNFRKSDIFNINGNGKSQRPSNKYHSIATSNGYLNYLSEGENSFNNDSLFSNYSIDELMNEASQTSTQAAEVNPSNVDNSDFSINAIPPQFDTLKSGAPSLSILAPHDQNQSHSSLRKITFDDSCELTNSVSHKAIKNKSSETEDLPSLTSEETQNENPRPTRIKELARQRMSMFNEINAILDRLCISNISYEIDQRALPSVKFKTVNNFTHSLGSSSGSSSADSPYQPLFYNNLDNTSEITSLYHVMTTDKAPNHELSESDSESEAHEKMDNPIINPVMDLPVIALEGKVINTKAIVNEGKNEKIVKNKKSRGFMSFGKGLKKFKSFITGNNSNKKKKVPMRVRSSSIYMDPEGRGVQYSIEKVILCDEEDNNENTEFPDTIVKN